jgi:hypothetical protein
MYAEIPFNAEKGLSPAVLRLPVSENTMTSCLSLSYVFEKQDVIKVKVSVRLQNNNDVKHLWSVSKGLSTWSTANITIDGEVSEINVTAIPLVSTYTTGVAIDDVILLKNRCQGNYVSKNMSVTPRSKLRIKLSKVSQTSNDAVIIGGFSDFWYTTRGLPTVQLTNLSY